MGISTHSTNKAFVIFSNQKVLDNEIYLLDTAFLKQYEPLIKKATGFWQGTQEPIYILPITNQSQEWFNTLLSTVFNTLEQDAILICSNYKHGLYKSHLVYSNGTTVDVGYFRSVRQDIAEKHESYSIIDGNYYIATESDTTIICELQKLNLI